MCELNANGQKPCVTETSKWTNIPCDCYMQTDKNCVCLSHTDFWLLLVSWCFKPSQPQRITSGLTYRNRVRLLHANFQQQKSCVTVTCEWTKTMCDYYMQVDKNDMCLPPTNGQTGVHLLVHRCAVRDHIWYFSCSSGSGCSCILWLQI